MKMSQLRLMVLCVLLIITASVRAAALPAEESAARLAARVLGPSSAGFRFEQIDPDHGQDVFELESRGGRIVVRGNSPLSMAVGLNWYLKYHAHASVSLNGSQTKLPDPLPALSEKFRQVAWAKSRYFLNYCTFGYSMPWWDWKQWEFFIDWMALNGINQPLAVTGQEAVWQALGRRFNMTEEEINAFLAGPPYLPFQWMGCLDGHGGPLPKEWIPQHVELEKRILARERELGMTPVLQGFTGHVPEPLLKKFPAAKAQKIHWIEWNTWMLDPTDPLFQQLGAAFIEEQTKLYGSDHLYDADSFIEMTPPSGDTAYLAKLGRAIYDGMATTDPQAVWLLQGWTFMNQAGFWKQDRIRAFLDAIPNDHLQVLDLFCESHPVWRETQGFYGKPWVWNFVYLFGNNTLMGASGPLSRFNDLAAARKDPLGKNLAGVGLMMEGFGHNPLMFDLMFELGWRDDVELKSWMKEFPRFRYGESNLDAETVWETLRTSVYGGNRNTESRSVITSFPSIGRGGAHYPQRALDKAWRLLLQAAPALGQAETYRHDLVNVARQSLSSRSGALYAKAMEAYQSKDAKAFRMAADEFLQLVRDLDELLATNDQFLLGRWLEDAKRWGATDNERAKLEWNARRVLTLWGTGAALRDYAWKEWSGMLGSFYGKRWEILFRRQQEALESGKPFDPAACHAEIYQFENDWAKSRETYPDKPHGDSITVARRLYEKYTPKPIENLALNKPVTCSFSLPGMDAALANDGSVDQESYWGTDVLQDKESWWQVDLQQSTAVGRAVVVGYFGDQRAYGFTVEVSTDGRKWELVADRRDNKDLSTRLGYACTFTPRPVRYVRVTETANSANTGRHLVEVLVFDK